MPLSFADLAQAVHDRHVRYQRDADLPAPNVYWSTVQLNDGCHLNGYVAADHTAPALRKTLLEAQQLLKVRLSRANSVIRLRRLKLGDLLECPEAFEQALAGARQRNESDIVQALQRLPEQLAIQLGVTLDHDSLWARLCDEINAPLRTLRPAV